jgi:carotenoid cleavage dioxygenase
VHAGDDHDTVVVHPDARHDTELVVLDAADLTRSPVASVRIPRRIPHGLHAAWIPSNR